MGRRFDKNSKRARVTRAMIDRPDYTPETIKLMLAGLPDALNVSLHYIRCIRARLKNTLMVLREAGCDVPTMK